MTTTSYPLRPFLPADTAALQDLFAASIEELTQDDYDDGQRLAWIEQGADAEAFAKRLGEATTLIVNVSGEALGFASLSKDNKVLDMLFVHPHHAGLGVGSALCDAMEKIAAARGAEALSVDASETAVLFFEARGYAPIQRNSIPVGEEWLTNTTMTKQLKGAAGAKLAGRPRPS
jgi:putative acetyltransferase